MNLADCPTASTAATGIRLTREQTEKIALALAAREAEFIELIDQLARQRDSLAATRGLLLRTLWPRPESTA